MSALLSELTLVQLLELLNFESPECSFAMVKDVARSGQQHIECLSIIFSGQLNGGVSYCTDDLNPFTTESVVAWKKDWQLHFPSLGTLEKNDDIPKHLFNRGFIKKSKKSYATPTSSATSLTSSSSSSSTSYLLKDPPSTNMSWPVPLNSSSFYEDYRDDLHSSSDVPDIDLTSEHTSSRQLFLSGDVSEGYVIDNITSDNKAYCSLVVQGSVPLDMEFNLDETCAIPRSFATLPGTHRWMLYKDIVHAEVKINSGTFMSIVAILPDARLTCCEEIVGPSEFMFTNRRLLYKLHRDHFRMPPLYFSSPISIE